MNAIGIVFVAVGMTLALLVHKTWTPLRVHSGYQRTATLRELMRVRIYTARGGVSMRDNFGAIIGIYAVGAYAISAIPVV